LGLFYWIGGLEGVAQTQKETYLSLKDVQKGDEVSRVFFINAKSK